VVHRSRLGTRFHENLCDDDRRPVRPGHPGAVGRTHRPLAQPDRVLFVHTSLDGFVGGPNGEMDWIDVSDEMFEYVFGSPSVAHALMTEDLIDDYRLFINPVLLGKGIPVFKDIKAKAALGLVASQALSSGVVCLHSEDEPT